MGRNLLILAMKISSVVDILKRAYFNKYSKAKRDGWRKGSLNYQCGRYCKGVAGTFLLAKK
jgi:hypothetical protein